MEINKFYLLEVWLITIFCTAFVCAWWPDIRTYPFIVGPESFAYKAGMFCGVIVFELEFSVTIFICLYLVFYLFIRKFFLPALLVKSVFFVFFLIATLIVNHIYFSWTWLHPFFKVYLISAIISFYLFDNFSNDWEYSD
jgi:hypothetical protein